MKLRTLTAALLALPMVTACVMPNNPFVRDNKQARSKLDHELQPMPQEDLPSAVVVHPSGYMHVHRASDKAAEDAQTAWLRAKRVTLAISKPVSAEELARMLKDKGINVTSTLPLDQITYSGLGVRDVNGETAIQMLLGAMGLDYTLDNKHHFVRIEPMPTRTWRINIGRRITGYQSLAANGNGGSGTTDTSQGNGSNGNGSSSGGGGGSSSMSGSGGSNGSGSNSSSNSNSSNHSSNDGSQYSGATNGGLEIDQAEDFWHSLRSEIANRLTLLVPAPVQRMPGQSPALMPTTMLPGLPGAGGRTGPSPMLPAMANIPQMPAPTLQQNGKHELFIKQQFGVFSTNPETGAITVQAPHWLLDKLGKYLTEVQTMYNADITFQGELLMLTTDTTHQEGFDVSLIAQDMQRYGAVVSNNALGGITVSFPNGMKSVMPQLTGGTSGGLPLTGGPLLGLVNKNGLDIFNAYLNQIGRVKVMQKPILSTTSGVPGEFARTQTIYYVEVSQQATAGNTGSAAVATTNKLVPIELGTTLRINPRYDVKENLIRAQINLHQDIQSGVQNFDQYMTGTGTEAATVHTPVPIVTHLSYSGEALLHDGDLIVIGGMHDDQDQDKTTGIPGLMDSLFSPFFGQKSVQKTNSTYYFALRVKVTKK